MCVAFVNLLLQLEIGALCRASLRTLPPEDSFLAQPLLLVTGCGWIEAPAPLACAAETPLWER